TVRRSGASCPAASIEPHVRTITSAVIAVGLRLSTSVGRAYSSGFGFALTGPMRLDDQRRSSNIEDQRSGGGIGLPVIGGGIGTIVILIVAAIFGINPRQLLQQNNQPAQQQAPANPASTTDPQVDFVAAVLGDTEDVWHAYFREHLGQDYQEPHLVLFNGAVQSACGFAQSATGPFYCPLDDKVYI